MTKHLTQEKMHRCLESLNTEYREGRAESAPLRKDDENIVGEYMHRHHDYGTRQEIQDEDAEAELRLDEMMLEDCCADCSDGSEEGMLGEEEIALAGGYETDWKRIINHEGDCKGFDSWIPVQNLCISH